MVLVHLQYSVTIFADKITFSHLTSCIQCSFEDMSFHTRADVHVACSFHFSPLYSTGRHTTVI